MSRKNKKKTHKRKSTTSQLNKLIKRRDDLVQDREKLALENKKKLRLRKLKLYLAVMKLSLPFVISSGVCVGGGVLLFDSLPFVVDEQKLTKKHDFEIDDDSIVYEEKYYKPSIFEEEDENQLEVKYAFRKDKEGTYSRNVVKYTYDNEHALEVIDAVLDDNYDILRSLAETKTCVTETRNTADGLTDGSIKGQITFKDESDFFMTKESDFKNRAVTMGELAIVFLVSFIGFKVLDHDIKGRKAKLENEYQLADLTELDKEITEVEKELQKVKGVGR